MMTTSIILTHGQIVMNGARLSTKKNLLGKAAFPQGFSYFARPMVSALCRHYQLRRNRQKIIAGSADFNYRGKI